MARTDLRAPTAKGHKITIPRSNPTLVMSAYGSHNVGGRDHGWPRQKKTLDAHQGHRSPGSGGSPDGRRRSGKEQKGLRVPRVTVRLGAPGELRVHARSPRRDASPVRLDVVELDHCAFQQAPGLAPVCAQRLLVCRVQSGLTLSMDDVLRHVRVIASR